MTRCMMLKKEIFKKKKIITQIIVICCFIWMIILEALPNRMTYSIKEQGDNMYFLSVSDNQGEIIYENQYYAGPIVSKVGKNTIKIVSGLGDGRQYRFINGKTGSISNYFEGVCGCNEKLVVYATYNEGSIKVIIEDIYKDEVYKEIIDDFIPTAVPSYAIKDVQIINNHLVYLRYYVGDSAIWREREEKGKLVFVK